MSHGLSVPINLRVTGLYCELQVPQNTGGFVSGETNIGGDFYQNPPASLLNYIAENSDGHFQYNYSKYNIYNSQTNQSEQKLLLTELKYDSAFKGNTIVTTREPSPDNRLATKIFPVARRLGTVLNQAPEPSYIWQYYISATINNKEGFYCEVRSPGKGQPSFATTPITGTNNVLTIAESVVSGLGSGYSVASLNVVWRRVSLVLADEIYYAFKTAGL